MMDVFLSELAAMSGLSVEEVFSTDSASLRNKEIGTISGVEHFMGSDGGVRLSTGGVETGGEETGVVIRSETPYAAGRSSDWRKIKGKKREACEPKQKQWQRRLGVERSSGERGEGSGSTAEGVTTLGACLHVSGTLVCGREGICNDVYGKL